MAMKKSVRFVVGAVGMAVVLAASACTEVVQATTPTWTSDGTFEFTLHDGGSTIEGGGPVSAVVSASGPDALNIPTECSPGQLTEGSTCSRLYFGAVTTKPGFIGDPGKWTVDFRTYRWCSAFDSCNPPLDVTIEQVRTPDGTDGMDWFAVSNAMIDGTDGCPGRGVKFEGTGSLLSDSSIDVDVRLVLCSPGLAAHMEATRKPR
jgi:hypothetical protein